MEMTRRWRTSSFPPPWFAFNPVPSCAGHSYRLAYGNEKAPPPQYDLERTLHVSAAEEAFPDTLANEQENNAYQDPRPFSERHPALLWAALALAALALGYTALRTMPHAPACAIVKLKIIGYRLSSRHEIKRT